MIEGIKLYAEVRIDFFAKYFLPHHCPTAFGAHHYEWFERVVDDQKLVAIAAPRGSAKTTWLCLIKTLHLVCYQKARFIIIISDTFSLAVARLRDLRAEIEANERLRVVFGNLKGNYIWRESDFITKTQIRIAAKGRGAQIRGEKHGPYRPSHIFLDDVESFESAMSPTQRQKTFDWYVTDVRRAGSPDGMTQFVTIGTYLHPDALLPSLVKNPVYLGLKHAAVKTWSTNQKLWDKWRSIMTDLTWQKPELEGDAFFEDNREVMLHGVQTLWEGIDYLTVQKAIVSDGYAAVMREYQNEPLNPEDFLFDMENALRFSIEDDGLLRDDYRFVKWEQIIGGTIFLDWAGGKDSIDNCFACAVLLLWEKNPVSRKPYAYLIDAFMDKVPLSKQIAGLFELYDKYALIPIRIHIEDFIKNWRDELKSNVTGFVNQERERRGISASQLPIHWHQQRQNKVERMTSLEPVIANGWLSFSNHLAG